MLTLLVDAIDARAQTLAAELARLPGVRAEIIDGVSTTGGGSAPGSALPTRLIALETEHLSASVLEARLRAGDPPIIARIQDDRVVLDLRTMMEGEDTELVEVVRSIVRTSDSE
jgi:L-seryl-tRNA(Ser) seleniumtransferase